MARKAYQPDPARGERMRVARDHAGHSQQKVSALIGADKSSVYQWEIGRSLLADALLLYAQACGVRPEWLLTGEGDMVPNEPRRAPPPEVWAEFSATTEFQLAPQWVQRYLERQFQVPQDTVPTVAGYLRMLFALNAFEAESTEPQKSDA